MEDYVQIIDDPGLQKLEKDRDLSPNTKLRILQRKLEMQRREQQRSHETSVAENPITYFDGSATKNSPFVSSQRQQNEELNQKAHRRMRMLSTKNSDLRLLSYDEPGTRLHSNLRMSSGNDYTIDSNDPFYATGKIDML